MREEEARAEVDQFSFQPEISKLAQQIKQDEAERGSTTAYQRLYQRAATAKRQVGGEQLMIGSGWAAAGSGQQRWAASGPALGSTVQQHCALCYLMSHNKLEILPAPHPVLLCCFVIQISTQNVCCAVLRIPSLSSIPLLDLQERMQAIRQEQDDAEVKECSFRPAINSKSSRMVQQRQQILKASCCD